MKIAFTGGGTLGHIYPALSIIEYINEKDSEKKYKYIWIGRENAIEKNAVEKYNIRYFSIKCGKLRRYFSLNNFIDIFKVFIGYYEAKQILKREKPDLLFSKGGFVSVPVVYAARHLHIKIVTHESDISLGLATRLNAKVANLILKGFTLNEKEMKNKKYMYCGNPIRNDLIFFKDLNIEKYEKDLLEKQDTKYRKQILPIYKLIEERFDLTKKIILVIGGSLGALEINNLIQENLNTLTKDYNIYHQMGENTFKYIERDNYICTKYINEELGYLLKKADLIISRCGANSLNEEIAFKKNILAIPLKTNSSRGEQVLNANYYKSLNLLEVLSNSYYFVDTIKDLFDNSNIKKREKAFEKYAIINSNEIICKKIEEFLN